MRTRRSRRWFSSSATNSAKANSARATGMGKPELASERSVLAPGEGASFTLHGAGASAGIAIGYAHLVTSARLEAPRYEIDPADVETEIERFDAAVQQVRDELTALHAAVPEDAPPEMAAFLDLHRMVLDDAMLSQ